MSGKRGFLCLLLACSSAVFAQKGSSGSSPSPGTSTTTSNPTSTTTTSRPSLSTSTSTMDQARPIFLSGNVLFDDGRAPSSDVRIERVCNGNTHVESHTDSKGHFSFQIGAEQGMNIADASTSNNDFGRGNSNSNSGTFQNPLARGSFGSSPLAGCDLRASYPGYISDSIDLTMRRSLDDPKVGTIVLHHLGNVQGTTISATTAAAPKSAMKSFEKGNQLVQKGKFEEAEERFSNATAEYPKFAAAWFALGDAQHKLKKLDDARKSFESAIAADNHYVSPYDQLALVSAEQGNWEDTAKYSKQAIALNPVEFPTSFWYNALANYNLKNFADAEKSAKALVKLDTRHRFPQAETMLTELAAQARNDPK